LGGMPRTPEGSLKYRQAINWHRQLRSGGLISRHVVAGLGLSGLQTASQ